MTRGGFGPLSGPHNAQDKGFPCMGSRDRGSGERWELASHTSQTLLRGALQDKALQSETQGVEGAAQSLGCTGK